MSKKWTKAQYGRERYLAKEFIKSKLSNLKEQLTEQKLRESIREILTEAIKKVPDAEDGSGYRQDWIGIYKGKFIQFKANFPVDARQHTINYFKVPKSKYSEVVVISKSDYDDQLRLKVEGKLTEAKAEIVIDLKDFDKVKKLVKKIKGQIVKHPYAKKTFGVKVDKNQYNKSLEFLMKNKINPRG